MPTSVTREIQGLISKRANQGPQNKLGLIIWPKLGHALYEISLGNVLYCVVNFPFFLCVLVLLNTVVETLGFKSLFLRRDKGTIVIETQTLGVEGTFLMKFLIVFSVAFLCSYFWLFDLLNV